MGDFYNGNKLLSMRTLDGGKPEIYMCVGNRTAGKTFYFKRYMVRRFIKHGEKFVVFVRPMDDIPNTVDGFFADIGPLEFPGRVMTQRPILHGKAAELLLDDIPCGYVIALNNPDLIKRNSALFADAQRGFMDEFINEDGRYLSGELRKFNSVRVSIARGGATGAHTRYFPVFMAANTVTAFNPYFDYWDVAARLDKRTKFLRGKGWVLEKTYNEEAARKLRENNKSMSADELAYAAGNAFLLDKNQFVKNISGNKYCILGIHTGNHVFGVWMCRNGKVFVSRKCDPGVNAIIATTEEDHLEGTYLMGPTAYIVKQLRTGYEHGSVYFDSGRSRYAFIQSMRIK